jgi:mono/diheme cytochrome c family protein
VPRERPAPPPFEPASLERSLDRYLVAGLVFMALLIAGFITYKVREPTLRSDAAAEQKATYTDLGRDLFENNCSSCHGKGGVGGDAPVLDAKEFLASTTDKQIEDVIAGGVAGSDMPAWSLEFGGQLTDEQVREITTYLRSLAPDAPSVPNWRSGKG